jgi:hypothetical protein
MQWHWHASAINSPLVKTCVEVSTPTAHKRKAKIGNPPTTPSPAPKVRTNEATSSAKQTPVRKALPPKQATPASVTPTGKNVNQMLELDVPETFLKTQVGLFFHVVKTSGTLMIFHSRMRSMSTSRYFGAFCKKMPSQPPLIPALFRNFKSDFETLRNFRAQLMMSKLQSWFPNHKSLHLAT